MKYEEAKKVFQELKKYRETEDESVMKAFSINYLRRALGAYHADKGWAHYDDLESYVKQREAEKNIINEKKAIKWWHDPLLVGIVSAIVGAVVGAYLGALCMAKFAEAKQLTIPTTVADRYGNKLHLEEPVAHKGYYEYPIIIYDKANNYRRIDKYAFGKELGIKFDGE